MKSIDGRILKEMLISAANNLYNNYPRIDALNVFPVPDGDTGMNMNLTLQSGVKEIANRSDEDVYVVASSFSKGLLMGARGNSGVITSQIFRGFSSSFKGLTKITAIDLIEAFNNGQKTAYKAVMRPVEGTILTVIRESTEATLPLINENSSVEDVFKNIVKEAKNSLKRTPDLLPVLKEAGVVDSGAAGLVVILEGMQSVLKGKFINKDEEYSVNEDSETSEELNYKINFILRLATSDAKKLYIEETFKRVLSRFGRNVEINKKSEHLIEVELSTLNPGAILVYAQGYGEFANIRIANTSEKYLLEDKDSKTEEPLKEYAIVSVCAGSGIESLFKSMGVNELVSGGQTMNPSIEDIINAINNCHAKNVYVLPNNSNIILAASQAADVVEGINVLVVPTKTIPQGITAVQAFNPDEIYNVNYNNMKAAAKTVKSGSITYAIKDTVVDGVNVTKDHFMGIKDKNIVVCKKDKFEVLYDLLNEMVSEDNYLVTVIAGEDISDSDIENIKETLQAKYRDAEVDVIKGNQPVYSFLIGVE